MLFTLLFVNLNWLLILFTVPLNDTVYKFKYLKLPDILLIVKSLLAI